MENVKFNDCDYFYLPETWNEYTDCPKCRGVGGFLGYKKLRGPYSDVPNHSLESDEIVHWDDKLKGWYVLKIHEFFCDLCYGTGKRILRGEDKDRSADLKAQIGRAIKEMAK